MFPGVTYVTKTTLPLDVTSLPSAFLSWKGFPLGARAIIRCSHLVGFIMPLSRERESRDLLFLGKRVCRHRDKQSEANPLVPLAGAIFP